MHSLSALLSVILHCVVIAVMLFWPSSPAKVDLDKPVVQVRLVSLAVKAKPVAPKPKAKKQPEKQEKKAPPKPEPKPKPEPVKETPPVSEPVPVPAPKPEPKPAPKPEQPPKPKPEAKPISPKKTPPEPKPEEKKEAPKPEPKPEPKKVEPKPKPKPKPKKKEPPKPSSDDILRKALAETKASVKQQEEKEQDTVAQELADLKGQVALTDPELVNALKDLASEEGEGEIASAEELYALGVSRIIKKKWRFPPLAVREVLLCTVRIAVGRNGEIVNSRIVASSGKPQFDASALRAVADTGQLPKPPRSDIKELTINFNSHEQ